MYVFNSYCHQDIMLNFIAIDLQLTVQDIQDYASLIFLGAHYSKQ